MQLKGVREGEVLGCGKFKTIRNRVLAATVKLEPRPKAPHRIGVPAPSVTGIKGRMKKLKLSSHDALRNRRGSAFSRREPIAELETKTRRHVETGETPEEQITLLTATDLSLDLKAATKALAAMKGSSFSVGMAAGIMAAEYSKKLSVHTLEEERKSFGRKESFSRKVPKQEEGEKPGAVRAALAAEDATESLDSLVSWYDKANTNRALLSKLKAKKD